LVRVGIIHNKVFLFLFCCVQYSRVVFLNGLAAWHSRKSVVEYTTRYGEPEEEVELKYDRQTHCFMVPRLPYEGL